MIDRSRATPAERIARHTKRAESGCLEWQGTLTKFGYGRIWLKDKCVRVHRLSYEIAHGEVPAGLDILHTCDNEKCCEPSHLYAGTDLDNTRDRIARKRDAGPSRRNRDKTVCKRGHPFAGDNLYMVNGYRRCRECERIRARRRYQSNPGRFTERTQMYRAQRRAVDKSQKGAS